MLCQFTFKNFYCFKDANTLDMQAASITEMEDSVIVDSDEERFLPLAAIYGPNGGGKSTVLKAFFSLAKKVMRPICAIGCDNEDCIQSYNDNSFVVPFAFDTASAKSPTEFELFFRTKKAEYKYNLHLLREKVEYESLWKRDINGFRYSELFTRTGQKKISLHNSFKNYITDVDSLTAEIPLLSFFGITHRRNSWVKDIVHWFEEEVNYINYANPRRETGIPVSRLDAVSELVCKMFEEMGIDINNFRVEENGEKFKIYTQHIVNNKKFELDLKEESHGTIKLFGLLPCVAESLKNGTTLFVDELDSKLHPKLLAHIVKLFSDPSINTKKSQLIFTSHDLTTMSSDYFRRDEIWFAAKNLEQASTLYSLVEFKEQNGAKTRKDAKYSKQYLEGRYGADPYLQRIINWEEI